VARSAKRMAAGVRNLAREEIFGANYLVDTGSAPHSTPHTQRARGVKRPDRETASPTSIRLRDYECEIFYLHFPLYLHDILRRHRGVCWELLRKSRAKSSQHSRFSIAVSLNNLKSHQTGRVNGYLFGT
jgi:hypothetical protein